MPRECDSAHATAHQRHRLSPQEKKEHKQRVLTQGAPSVTGSIADAVVVKPEAFERRLRIERQQLPDFVHWIETHDLKVGEASVDLRFERRVDGTIAFSVMKVDGKLDVIGPEDSDERQRIRAPIAR
jgi:hypothetical protein